MSKRKQKAKPKIEPIDPNEYRYAKDHPKYQNVEVWVKKRTHELIEAFRVKGIRKYTMQGIILTREARTAARQVDMYLISKGKEPVNVLKRKV